MQGDTYIGIDGRPWAVMSYPDALDIITWLAEESCRSDAKYLAWLSRNGRDTDQDREVTRLCDAITTATDFITTFHTRLDALKPPRLGTGWPEFVYADLPTLDPANRLHAIRICLAAAEPEAIAPSEAERLFDRYGTDIEQRAEDMVRSLIGLHGATINKWPTMDQKIPSLTPSRVIGPH